MFVDDEDAIVDVNTQFLQRLGYMVTGVTHPADAILTFRKNPDAFDLLICDKTMARLTGFDVVREIRKQRPQLPVILWTGVCDQDDVAKSRELEIDEFVMKPIHGRALARIIREVLDRRHVSSTFH